MQKKRGISLIVLVITIIVMIILAGAIILSLNNAGIIGKANQAVDSTNEATVKQLADLKWSEAYLEGNKTASDLREAVLDKLAKEKVDISPYEILVTEKGVVVNRLTTVAELQQQHQFTYYDTLSTAIDDINAGTIGTNDLDNKTGAKAGVYTVESTGEDGTTKQDIYVVLLDSYTENTRLKPTVDMTINLGGKTLTFDRHLGITSDSDGNDTIVIDGRLQGSTIIVNGSEIGTRIFQIKSNTFVINGGTYIANTVKDIGDSTEYSAMIVHSNEGGGVTINNASMHLNMLVEKSNLSGSQTMNVGAVVSYSDCNINNSNITISALNNSEHYSPIIVGVQFLANGIMKDTTIVIKSNIKPVGNTINQIVGCDVYERSVLEKCTVKIEAEQENNTYIHGIKNASETICNGCNINVKSGNGITNVSTGNMQVTNTIINGNIENNGKLFIDGTEYVEP